MTDSVIVLCIVLGLLFFGPTYVAIGWTFNVPIQAMNDYVDKGMISDQTMTHFKDALNLWKAMPFFFLVGLVLFCVERAKGAAVYPSQYFEYLILMIVTVVMSCYFVMSIGIALDSTLVALNNCDFITHLSAEWGATKNNGNILIDLEYYCAMAPGVLGTLLYSIFAIRKQRDNSLTAGESSDSSTGEAVTQYQLQQF